MWYFSQLSGQWRDDNHTLVGVGYSGKGPGKNNPTLQEVKYVGPIPVGRYTINPPIDTEKHGPYVLWLTPDPSNNMFGRSEFGIHGDSFGDPGNASEGCIILSRDVREKIWNSGDHDLTVVSGIVTLNPEMFV